MDLRTALFDVDLLLSVARDVAAGLQTPVQQLPLLGDTPLEQTADPTVLIARLQSYTAATPLWVLQWTLLVSALVSDAIVGGIRSMTPSSVFEPWFNGREGSSGSLEPFRTRIETALTGTYMHKRKRGSRKLVHVEALTPLEATVAEALLLHTLACGGV